MLSEQELLEMERPVSARHAPMRRCDRAAQFAPFAALSGFGEAVQEAGRLARERIESAERSDKLPDAELAVMQAVWACEAPAKRAQIAAILDKTHPMAPTTLLTVLSRLADKGFLRIEKTGRSAEYWPLVAREAYLARQGRKFYDTLCGGSLPAFAAALCASGLTAEELEELRELLREGTL